jgi:flagellar biosynthetic protein FlhB
MADNGQRTEPATPRRIEKARREGQFLSARHLVASLQFLVFVALLGAWGGDWLEALRDSQRTLLKRAFGPELTARELLNLTADVLWQCSAPLLVAGAILVIFTLAVQLALTRMGVSLNKIAPDLKRLSPMARLRELPRQNLPAFLQALIMLPLFGWAVYAIARDKLPVFLTLPMAPAAAGAMVVAASLQELMWKAAGVFLVFGLVDLFRQQRRYQRDLRMSKQEIRDELKEIEGNPQMKARIRRLRRDVLRRRMMQQVPTATAVVVNPTHYAVAIRYDMQGMTAPVVVAKGKNYLAQRIRKMAVEHQVPLVENPPLAQALYKSVDVGQEIPAHLYRAVAEILAYIYRLMNRK